MNHKNISYFEDQVGEKLETMSHDEKIGQLLCWDVSAFQGETGKIVEIVRRFHLGSLFIFGWTSGQIQRLISELDRDAKTPILIASDLEHGAGPAIAEMTEFPFLMTLGAANDPSLSHAMGLATAREGAAAGVQWTYGPVVDINMNRNNPVVNVRSFSDDPERIAALAAAYIRGIQSDNRMAAAAKHFPGDGVDDRDQHLCTSVNSLTRKEWERTFGGVWEKVIKEDVMSIMVGHIALPFIDEGPGYVGGIPATLSHKIQTDFLRKELGFKGLIVSDAICMVGLGAHLKRNEIAVKNILAGSNVVLFSEPERDFNALKQACAKEELSSEHLDETASYMLAMKYRLGMLDKRRAFEFPSSSEIAGHHCTSLSIAQQGATLARNVHSMLPLRLKPGSKVLTVTMQYDSENGSGQGQDQGERYRELTVIDEELRRRGYSVEHAHNTVELVKAKRYDAVFFNVKIIPHCCMGTVRMVGPMAASFWDSLAAETENLVITSFGSPYLSRELSFAPTMLLMHGYAPDSQRAAVQVWLGEIPVSADNCPVCLE